MEDRKDSVTYLPESLPRVATGGSLVESALG